jgi:hypothetical protein
MPAPGHSENACHSKKNPQRGPSTSWATSHKWRWLRPATTSSRINVHRVHRKEGRATSRRIRPRQTGSLVLEGVIPCTSPAPSPTSHLAPNPALVSQLLTQGYSSKNNTLLWPLNFSFKIFYTYSFNINFFPLNINTSCPIWYYYWPKMPSECPSLTLHMIYCFIKK